MKILVAVLDGPQLVRE